MNKKQNYTAPEVELVEVRTECRILNGSVKGVKGADMDGWGSSKEEWD